MLWRSSHLTRRVARAFLMVMDDGDGNAKTKIISTYMYTYIEIKVVQFTAIGLL